MVIPSTPTIPSHEDGNSRPEPSLNDGIYLVYSPLHASRNISHPAPTRIRWMFIKLARSQDPGDAGQFSSKRILCELVRGELVPPANTAQILKRVSSIVAPSQFVGFKAQWKRGGDSRSVSGLRVVYEGRVGSDQHQMVRRRRPSDVGEILVAERKFSSVCKVSCMSASTNCWRTEVACRVSQALCRWSGSRGGGLGDLGIVIPLAPGKVPK